MNLIDENNRNLVWFYPHNENPYAAALPVVDNHMETEFFSPLGVIETWAKKICAHRMEAPECEGFGRMT